MRKEIVDFGFRTETLPITIYGELYSSKNSKQIARNRGTGKMFIRKSDAAKGAEAGLLMQLNAARAKWSAMVGYKEAPLRVQFKIYRRMRQRFDYVNIVQSLLDLMVKARWIEDDNSDIIIPEFAQYEVDSKNPRTEISVL